MMDHGLTPESVRFIAGQPNLQITQTTIDQAVVAARNIAGWHVTPPREETITVDTRGDCMQELPTKYVLGVQEVRVKDKEVTDFSWSQDGLLLFPKPLPQGFRTLQVTLKHGFPVEAAMDFLVVAAHMAARSSQHGGNITVGSISIGASATITPQSSEWRIMDIHKLGPIP